MSNTRKALTPGCLAYIAHTSTDEEARGRVVIAVRPWAVGDVFHIAGERFAEPTEHDIWFIKPARDGDTLPVVCTYERNQVFRSEGVLGVERAVHLIPLNGPGLISEADMLRERARDLQSYKVQDMLGVLHEVKPRRYWGVKPLSNTIFPDISELDRTFSRVLAHKVFIYKQTRGLL